MRRILLLVAILGVALAGPVKVEQLRENLLSSVPSIRNSALEELILNLAEDLRAIIVNGSDDIPILDPFELDHLRLDGEVIGLPGSHIAIGDAVVSYLSTFIIHELSVVQTSFLLQRYRVEFLFGIPILEADTQSYDLFASTGNLQIFGAGSANLRITEPRIRGNLLVAPRISISSGIGLNLLECEIQFTLEAFEPQITGLFNDNMASSFVSSFIKNLVPELLEFYDETITEFLSTTVHEIANNILEDLNLSDILG